MDPSDSTALLFRRTPRTLRRGELRQFARALRDEVAEGRGFTCLIADDRELRRLNSSFLGKDYATDVLSFPSPGSESLGDIAISTERAGEQAAEFGHDVETEIKILMLHGVLHLLGMDHERDRGRMAKVEAAWRRRLGLPTGLIERVRA
ncbi:MAG: rRNA maturation RNase YbeY [Bryobacteraceae bacterium]